MSSSRVRFALLFTACTTAILVVFMAISLFWTWRQGLKDLDALLLATARSFFPVLERLEHVELTLVSSAPPDSDLPEFAVFQDSPQMEGPILSKSWPAALDPGAILPPLASREAPREPEIRQPPPGPFDHPHPPMGVGPWSPQATPGIARQAVVVERLKGMSIRANGELWRFNAFAADNGEVAILGVRHRRVHARLWQLAIAFLSGTPVALVLSFGAGLYLADRLQRPLRTLSREVEEISAEGLERRLRPGAFGAEYAPLIQSLNGMLKRLHRSFDAARQFSSLAAHELKTPLTILQGRIDSAIRSEQPGSSRQQFLADLLSHVARLKEITERLLLLAKADAGTLDLFVEDVDLAEMLLALVEDAELLAPEIAVETDLPEELTLEADRSLLLIVLQNLITNGLRHNRGGAGAFLSLGARRTSDGISLRVSNSGIPISETQRERIFARFHQGTGARRVRGLGAGLGLNLSRSIAHAHGGGLILEKSDSTETVFLLSLPLKPQPSKGTRTTSVRRREEGSKSRGV